MIEPDRGERPVQPPKRRTPAWPLGLAVFLVGLAAFALDLGGEPHFVDESAYVSQSYFADLLIEGRRDDPLWLEYQGYDLPPLPKYLIGFTLRAAGHGRPGPAAARSWYRDTSRRFETAETLVAARVPSALLGAVGCLSLFAIGVQLRGPWTGALAAALLAANPLYRMHARRAMSDVPAEALILATAAVGLWVWRKGLIKRPGPGLVLAATATGVLGGLATLAKLNGSLGLMTVLAWAGLGLVLGAFPVRRRVTVLGLMLLAGAVGFATFAALNPFLTASPPAPVPAPLEPLAAKGFWARAAVVAEHRAGVSSEAARLFPHNALTSPAEKVKAVAVQGFGRFGPLGPARADSTIRYDPAQDWGAAFWGPTVALGGLACVGIGRGQYRAGLPPTGWAVLAQATLALAVVTAFIPLAWDRYFLSIQAGSCLLAATLATTLAAGLVGLGRGEAR